MLQGGLLVMGDTTGGASGLPANLDAACGYDNGKWPDFPGIAAAFPHLHLLDMTVLLANVGAGGDFEPGDMTPGQAVTFVTDRRAAGESRPVTYASIGGYMPQIVTDLTAAGFSWPGTYRRWSAHYDWPGQLPGFQLGQHICGPFTCGSPIQCDGTQWIDHGGWDESLLDANFFGAPPPPPPPPPPPAIGEPQMYATDPVTKKPYCTDAGGNFYGDGAVPVVVTLTEIRAKYPGVLAGTFVEPCIGITPEEDTDGDWGFTFITKPQTPTPNSPLGPYNRWHVDRSGAY